MARNDPTSTGGMFVGRRPGTAPLRYRERPVSAGPRRRRLDRVLAGAILVVETLLLASLWGPQPAAWLWVGSQIDYLTGSVSLGILTAFVGMLVTIMGTLKLAKGLDSVWKSLRRAGGYEQKDGMLERVFVVGVAVGVVVFMIWFILIQGPGPSFAPSQ